MISAPPPSQPRFFRNSLLILLTLIMGGLLLYGFFQRKESHHTQQPKSSTMASTSSEATATSAEKSNLDHIPAPLDHLTAEEKELFPGARLLESKVIPGDHPGETKHLRHLYTHLKYPDIITEETCGPNGELLKRNVIAGDHLLVLPKAGASASELQGELGSIAQSITPLSANSKLYQVDLSSHDIGAIPRAQRALSNNPHVAVNVPDQLIFSPRSTPVHRVTPPPVGAFYFNSLYHASGANPVQVISQTNQQKLLDSLKTPNNPMGKTIVAIIDSGIRTTHKMITPYLWSDPNDANIHGINTVGQQLYQANGAASSQPENHDIEDYNGHGTFCAGIVAEMSDGYLGPDVGPQKIQIMGCKVMNKEGVSYEGDAFTSIIYAINHGATIINCSWDSPTNSGILESLMKQVEQKGITFVAAAGNDGQNLEEHPTYPAALQEPNLISVAALNQEGNLADFSNYSQKFVPLAAPGEEVIAPYNGNDNAYARGNGTSFAAPAVSAALAILHSEEPTSSPEELIEQIENQADQSNPDLTAKIKVGALRL